MSYQIVSSDTGERLIVDGNISIPLDPANRHYQKVQDKFNAEGASCFDGDVPQQVQDDAAARLFAQQLEDYTVARKRLDRYQLSVGVSEQATEEVVGSELDENGNAVDTVERTVTQVAIDPLPAQIGVMVSVDEDGTEHFREPEEDETADRMIDNPLVTEDNEERAAAQAVVDATPQAVIDAYNEG